MININNPRQELLFDPYENLFSPLAYKTIRIGWQGVFRHVILELLPADALAGEFHPSMGRPTKELYSAAGLVFIMEFEDWTVQKAAEAYMFNADIWYALNLEPGNNSMSTRTLERYQRLFRENELAKEVMRDVTMHLVEILEQNIEKQRLDSTHVLSDMATFGRTRLMGVTIKRFLTQVKRHNKEEYESLPEELKARYNPSEHQLFGNTAKDKQSHQLLRQQVAEDMYTLIERFVDDKRLNNRNTFKTLCTVFEQQCELIEEKVEVEKEVEVEVEQKVEVKAKTGGNVIQNPSDPDATYDGHKGPGYQVQLSETCSEENEVQLVTSAIAQTACESDTEAPEEVTEDLKQSDLLPGQMLADTLYGSDENVLASADDGIELISPVSGKAPSEGSMTISDFDVDDTTEEVQKCPAGHKPIKSEHNSETGKTRTEMSSEVCSKCPHRERCLIKQTRKYSYFEHTAKQRRIDKRRRNETTDEFRVTYNKRAGIEATNSGIKRRTGMARLRVRGKKSVFHAIILKIAGWNILQASRAGKMRKYVAEKMNKTVKQVVQGQNTGNSQSLISCVCSFVAYAWQKTGFTRQKVGNNNLMWYYQMKDAA